MDKHNEQILLHIAHEYMDLDISIIWETATIDIPLLRKLCKETLSIEE